MMEERILTILQTINTDISADPDMDLLSAGLLDSFDMVNIVAALEEKFGIEIAAEDIVPENFITLTAMVMMVKKYTMK